MIKKYGIKITICSVSGIAYEMVDENIICL